MKSMADDYLEKAIEAEERARSTRDPDIRARWLGIAFGYRELSRFRNSLQERLDHMSIEPVLEPRRRTRIPLRLTSLPEAAA